MGSFPAAAHRAVVKGSLELVEELAPKDASQDPNRKQKPGLGRDPSRAVWVKASSGDDAVEMRVIQERLCPGVEEGGEADPRAEVLGPESDLTEGFRNGGKEQVVGLLRIAEKQRVKGVGDGEDDVMILNGQQVALLRLAPARLLEVLALGAMAVATAIEGNQTMSAGVALVDVSTQSCRSALGDIADDSRLLAAQSGEPIGVLSEDVGEFRLRAARAARMARRAGHGSAVAL